MDQINSENWAIIHVGLVFLITFASLLVVYVLSGSSTPSPGLGLYTVYFMAALLGWIAYTLTKVADVPMPIDVSSVASVLNSYILFLAVGERAALKPGRIILGLICLAACLSMFFLSPAAIFLVQAAAAGLIFACTGAIAAAHAWRRKNIGDAITALATLLMVTGMPICIYYWIIAQEQAATTIAFGAHSTAYVLVATGFLASVVIEYQQHLSNLATEDPLTRLLNRRGLEGALHITLAHAARQQHPTSAIMVDIDGFKEVNDNFGPEAGDQVIRQVAEYLQRMSRASDVVARTGGEEFLIILPHTTLESARTLAERIRKTIAERPLVVDNQRIHVTASLGVASMTGDVQIDKLSQDADRAMYLAKRGGANRVASVENRPIHLSTGSRHT